MPDTPTKMFPAAVKRIKAGLYVRAAQLRNGAPGSRFRAYRKRFGPRSLAARTITVTFALIAWAIALVLSVAPGPGFVFFLLGLGLMASQSSFVARWMDKAEVAFRRMKKDMTGQGHEK
jgi:hypothetical protein